MNEGLQTDEVLGRHAELGMLIQTLDPHMDLYGQDRDELEMIARQAEAIDPINELPSSLADVSRTIDHLLARARALKSKVFGL